jgi:hypothetical protein
MFITMFQSSMRSSEKPIWRVKDIALSRRHPRCAGSAYFRYVIDLVLAEWENRKQKSCRLSAERYLFDFISNIPTPGALERPQNFDTRPLFMVLACKPE